jgi:phytoene dehydrogenase-like protein
VKRESQGYDAIVLSAGANGLTAAAALGEAGLRVLVLEESEGIGGDGRVIEFAPGFRAAPLATDAGWLPPAVAKGLGISPERADPAAPISVPVSPGEWLSLWADPSRAAAAVARYSERDAAQLPPFGALLARLSLFLGTLYQAPAPRVDATAPRDLFALLSTGLRLRRLGRTAMTEFLRMMPMPVEELVGDWFESGPLKAAVAVGGVRDLRQGPRSGGTTFNLMHYLIGAPAGSLRNAGWWRTGPDAFTEAGGRAVGRLGGTLQTAAKVRQINVKDDAVTGVVLESGEEISAPRVLSTLDPARTLLGLVDPVWLDPEFLHAVKNIKFRGATTFVMYALDALPDTKGLPTEALTGALSLTSNTTDLEQAADAAKYGNPSAKPHVEITFPSLRWPQLAPAGKHVVLARAQWTPYAQEPGAGSREPTTTDPVDAVIEAAIPCFGSRVLHRVTLTPNDIEQQFGLTEGAVTQGEMMLDQILFMRPVPGWGRHAMPIAGLYLGGAGTHPGPGIVGGSGWLAAKEMLSRGL